MTDYRAAVARKASAITTTGTGEPRSRGHIIAYTDEPQVCIEYPDGRKEWWLARLTLIDPEPPAQAAQDRPRRDETPADGGADGQGAPDAAQSDLRTLATDAAHHAQTQGGQAGIASGLAAIAYAILAGQEPR